MRRKKYHTFFLLNFLFQSIGPCSFASPTKVGSVDSKQLFNVILPKKGDGKQQSELFEFVLPEKGDSKQQIVQMIKYDKAIYDLAYTVYLQSGNPQKAYAVAMAAVKQEPQNKLWRERLAQVAIWSQEPNVALEQYLYSWKNFNDKNAELKGRDLAKKLHADKTLSEILLFDLNEGKTSVANWHEYIDIMLRLGEINKLLEILEKNRSTIPETLYLDTLATIYKVIDEPVLQLDILKKLSALVGMRPEIAERMAQLYVNQGNISEAERVMALARQNNSPKKLSFWGDYSVISFLANKPQDELYGRRQFLKEKKPSMEIFSRLIEITTKSEPNLAYQYAKQGIAQHPNNYYLASVIFSLMKKEQSIDFPKFEARMPPSILKLLHYETTFWSAKIDYETQFGDENTVFQTYLDAMNYLPHDPALAADFMYFLIEKNKLALLKQMLPLWQQKLPENQVLWGPYAETYARFDNRLMTKLILNLFYDQFKQYENNPYWLILFKDILENSFYDIQSAQVSVYAWPIYLNLLRNQKEPPNYVQLIDYVKLSMRNAFGDPTAVALSMLEKYENKDVELLMLTWALGHNDIALAKAIYSNYKAKKIEPPLWARLSIALARHDHTAMRDILRDKKAIVSYRDRVRAAMEIDALPYAQTNAYMALRRYRKDQDLYDNFFTPIMLKNSDNLFVSQEYYQYGNVVGPRTNASYTYFLMPSLSLTPYNSVWFTHNLPGQNTTSVDQTNSSITTTTNQVLRTVPSKDERAGVKISTRQRRGYLDLDLGYRNNLSSFFTAKITRTYTALSNLELTATLGYHQPADDTAGMLVGGRKNNLDLDFYYRLLKKDFISGNFRQNFFYTQGGQHLANGTQITLRYEHKFWDSYPDWTITPYGVVTDYYHKTTQLLRGSVLKLVPENIQPNVNFLIPADFNEFGLTFSFGQTYMETYTHRWRPFGSATISRSSTVGIGKLFNIGIAGMVFGRDHLLIYYEWGTNQGQGIQASRLAKISYRIYV
ncbi:tetratricopeptide repeat protein [Legionella maceachernii]|uniref:PelB C-terminal domain-containing protein n=1 Tax=Legionella maceachernii TaxID=466 RepID=A0A0W0W0J8_9GAMM|nr:tetratricopeptide repeat protein [Legionella maceachernii]KTD25900.1 hypothetical protein Lmac_1671 [Legionella maceachernii]SJZ47996.1 Tetratricopeptide repeat-containing protein [Legionella maceachernii]SUP03865.1 Uncharacterised protein [Legionella maceachernii]